MILNKFLTSVNLKIGKDWDKHTVEKSEGHLQVEVL